MEHPLVTKTQSLIQHEFATNPYYAPGLRLKDYIRTASHCSSAAQEKYDVGDVEGALVNFLRTMKIAAERIYPHRDYSTMREELRVALESVSIPSLLSCFFSVGFLMLWPLHTAWPHHSLLLFSLQQALTDWRYT